MKKCKVDDCKNNHWARGYCRSHLNHLTRYGEIRRLRNSGIRIVTRSENNKNK